MVDEVVLVAVAYHFKDVPVADNITAVSFLQYWIGVVAVGIAGIDQLD